jgi:hypothetical protein
VDVYEIRTRDVPEQVVVSERREVDQSQLVDYLIGAMGRVHKAAVEAGGVAGTSAWPYLSLGDRPDEPVFIAIYEGDPHQGPVPVEVCAPVNPGPQRSGLRRLPAHREAYARVTKETVESGQLGAVFGVVEEWIGTQGLEVAAAPREVYWTSFDAAAPGDVVLDVAWPVA